MTSGVSGYTRMTSGVSGHMRMTVDQRSERSHADDQRGERLHVHADDRPPIREQTCEITWQARESVAAVRRCYLWCGIIISTRTIITNVHTQGEVC